MKKKTRIQPLQLSRETIHQLDNDRLVHIDGGGITTTTTVLSIVVSCPQ